MYLETWKYMFLRRSLAHYKLLFSVGTIGVLPPPPNTKKLATLVAPERAWAVKCGGSGTSLIRFERELENASLRNCQDASGWRSGRLLTRGAAVRFAFGLSRPWEAMNGLKLKKFWKMKVSGMAKSAKKKERSKVVMLRNGFLGNLWKRYARRRGKFRAENAGLSRGTYTQYTYVHVHGSLPLCRVFSLSFQIQQNLSDMSYS